MSSDSSNRRLEQTVEEVVADLLGEVEVAPTPLAVPPEGVVLPPAPAPVILAPHPAAKAPAKPKAPAVPKAPAAPKPPAVASGLGIPREQSIATGEGEQRDGESDPRGRGWPHLPPWMTMVGHHNYIRLCFPKGIMDGYVYGARPIDKFWERQWEYWTEISLIFPDLVHWNFPCLFISTPLYRVAGGLGAWKIWQFPHPDYPWIGGYCDPRMVLETPPPTPVCWEPMYIFLNEKLQFYVAYGPMEPTEENHHRWIGDYDVWLLEVEGRLRREMESEEYFGWLHICEEWDNALGGWGPDEDYDWRDYAELQGPWQDHVFFPPPPEDPEAEIGDDHAYYTYLESFQEYTLEAEEGSVCMDPPDMPRYYQGILLVD
jgi:hypothetical protein